jgi:hypothetical protein
MFRSQLVNGLGRVVSENERIDQATTRRTGEQSGDNKNCG